MGKMSFVLPPGLSSDLYHELERACLAGGFDNAPVPTKVLLAPRRMTVQRALDESGYLIVPWEVDGVGRFMISSATLIEREEPYTLSLELARGKVHHLRNHLAEWRMLGFAPTTEHERKLSHLNSTFGMAATENSSDAAAASAQSVLRHAMLASDFSLHRYTEHLFFLRHQRNPRLDTTLGCELPALPENPAEIAAAFNAVRLPLTWRDIEPVESRYDWEKADAVLAWADANQMPVSGGPLLDFSQGALPEWLSLWEGDLSNLANFMCDYVETVISRYRGRIRRWLLTTAGNMSSVFSLGEDDMLWLTARLAEAALNIAPDLELVVGVSQPWGEYLACEEHTYTPLVFLDTLLRAGLRLAALDVELVMGVSPRGSYCRDLLDVNRLLDGFAVLSTPLQVTLACPSSASKDPNADPSLSVGAGHWASGFTADFQAEWAGQFAALALCKPYVAGVHWTHLNDAESHRFPHCGLIDSQNRTKPAFARLRQLREAHLR
jgi:glycosyl hydrolase family 10